MTESILRQQSDIPQASMAQLLATYTALTGRVVRKFESRAIAEVRVSNAMLSAQDAAGHLGVPRDARSPTLTVAERVQRAADKGLEPELPEQSPLPCEECDLEANPYPEGWLAHDLWRRSRGQQPLKRTTVDAVERRPVEPGRQRANVFRVVRFRPGGTSKPQSGSTRGKVLDALVRRGREIAVPELDAQLGFPTRPYIVKLLEKQHVEIVE